MHARLMSNQGIAYRSPLSNASKFLLTVNNISNLSNTSIEEDKADDDLSKWLFNQPKESEVSTDLRSNPKLRF